MPSKDNRLDNRSIKQFKKDIKQTTKEQLIVLRSWLSSINRNDLKITDNGVDNKGNYISHNKKITHDPDYHVELFGLIEVQYARSQCDTFFHIKKEKLLTCRKLKAKILMIDGWETDSPKSVLIRGNQLKVISKRCKVVKWQGAGGKEAYQIPLCWFDWVPIKRKI